MSLSVRERELLRTPTPVRRPEILSSISLSPRRAVRVVGRSIGVTGRTVGPGTAIPDSDVYLHDDFGDGKLTDRDGSGTTTYNGVEGVYRPEWTLDSGNPTVTNARLDYSEGDAGLTDINLDLSQTVTWELTNVTQNSAGYQLSFFGLYYENNPTRDTNNFPPTLYPGYYISSRSSDPTTRLDVVDGSQNITAIISVSTSIDGSDVTVARSPQGEWTLSINGSQVGSATDTTFTNPQYIDFVGRNGLSDNRLLVDEIKVF